MHKTDLPTTANTGTSNQTLIETFRDSSAEAMDRIKTQA